MAMLVVNKRRTRQNSVFRRLSVAPAQFSSLLSDMPATLRKKSIALFNLARPSDADAKELESGSSRYKPTPIDSLTRQTRFTKEELKHLYRGFKQECPSGIVTEETFKEIYAQFFPHGSNSGLYAHYVFNTLDVDRNGSLTFEQFVQSLSILSRGTQYEKLQWIFQLYDINQDGFISKHEMVEIVHSIHELMGRHSEPLSDDFLSPTIHAEEIFYKMDLDGDGYITIEEFIESCTNEKRIFRELLYFNTVL